MAGIGSGTEWIVDIRAGPGEIAIAHRLGRHGKKDRQPLPQPESFIVHEKERLIFSFVDLGNYHRTAERCPKLILGERGCGEAIAVIKEVVRIQDLIAKEFVDASMKLVRTALCAQINYTSGKPAVFG